MAADSTLAYVIPRMVLQGDPGAQRNRDQIYRAVKAIAFDTSNAPYRIPNVTETSGLVNIPSEVTFPMRNPDRDEGEGHWFVAGEKLTVEAEIELYAPPVAAGASIRFGLIWNPLTTTTLANALANAIPFQYSFTVTTAGVIGTTYYYRWTIAALSATEQMVALEQMESFNTGVTTGGTAGTKLASQPMAKKKTTIDFSGLTQRSLGVFASCIVNASDVGVFDVRLRRVTAYIQGIPGKNE
jgi:hypothetical protein